MKKFAIPFLILGSAAAVFAADSGDAARAVSDLERAMAIADASYDGAYSGRAVNSRLADTYDTSTQHQAGTCDVWPYTAAIEAHCSILEALEATCSIAPELYEARHDDYVERLDRLVYNLDYYRGKLTLSSYATSGGQWEPYAVHRSSTRFTANVQGIENVYDDQMWLCRELIRAYRLTDKEEYLETAIHLADYIIDGWDCWRDADGKEYGGITWGPGYNSKHACSNAPAIQPLVWLSQICRERDEEVEYRYRDASNAVVSEMRLRSELYLDFAARIYDWQKENLYSADGVYYDMKGADNTIRVENGYRVHIDCGGRTGTFFSYNTGTMIAGAAELYAVSGDERYRDDISASVNGSFNKFARYQRKHKAYELITDDVATSGFNTWFNDVLVRGIADAEPYCDSSRAGIILDSTEYFLDYAYDNHNRDGFLPIHLLDGWGEETVTKPFHQFAFASEYARLAVRRAAAAQAGVSAVTAAPSADSRAYTLQGLPVDGTPAPNTVYIRDGKKHLQK